MRTLVAWIGNTDTDVAAGRKTDQLGPIGQAVTERDFDRVVLLHTHSIKEAKHYQAWLLAETGLEAKIERFAIGPTQFGEIYEAAVAVVSGLVSQDGHESNLTFHLSPGTPAMAAVWVILAKTRFEATLIESSIPHGVKTVAVPFDISAEFVVDLVRKPSERLMRLTEGLSPEAPEFEDIVHQSRPMQRAVALARRLAPHEVPVLIEGETGTGKELFASAIHHASVRNGKPFLALNCGAVPESLIEAELFGSVTGAHSTAKKKRKGFFEAADGGTLFLDEIGEMSSSSQVRLLRVLNDGKITPLGTTESIKVDVRVLSATNRILFEEVTAGRFRDDLFWRLAVGVIKLPPIRSRKGDMNLLIDHILAKNNAEPTLRSSDVDKKLASGARNILLQHSWPGNVRELFNTLTRAAIFSNAATITVEDVEEALMLAERGNGADSDGILNRSIEEGLDLEEIIGKVEKHYISRAIEEGYTKGEAAEKLGFRTYQTFTNRAKKYGLIN